VRRATAGKPWRWYRAAAEQGDAEAQNSVGSGLQADKDYAGRTRRVPEAADQAHSLALNNLAYLYDLGLGVPQDRQRAFALYTQAANLGWAESMWNLANMYGAGQVGMADLQTACVWTLRADKYAEPRDARLRAQLTRVVPQLRGTLTAEQFATCKADSEGWSPTATVVGGKKKE
jgi:TPR repeat protein